MCYSIKNHHFLCHAGKQIFFITHVHQLNEIYCKDLKVGVKVECWVRINKRNENCRAVDFKIDSCEQMIFFNHIKLPELPMFKKCL